MNVTSTHELEDLADTLWAERHLVEYLLFKLVSARLLLAADESRFVPAAIEEVERAVTALRAAEVRRAMALQGVADVWKLDAETLTLRKLAERAPSPFDAMFRDHHRAFLSLTEEIESTARQNSQLASATLHHVRDSLTALGGGNSGVQYDARGRRQPAAGPTRLNEVL